MVIEFEAASKQYAPNSAFALGPVSFVVQPGELLVLLGGSGSGKTTTLKLINRMIEPSSGRILIDGQDVAHLDPVSLRRRIGYVIQGAGLFPHLTVAENIALVPSLLGWPAPRIARRVEELLELVQLPPDVYRSRWPASLSGGEQQRVGLARAIAAEPQLLLLDEPFGALDALTRESVRRQFLELRQRLALTAIMVTHDVTEALMSADRIAVLKSGRLLRIGTPRELVADPQHDFVRELLATPNQQRERLESLWAGATA